MLLAYITYGARGCQMTTKVVAAHQSLTTLEAVDRISPEVVGRVLVGELDQAPQRPQQIAHRLVDDHAAGERRARVAAAVGDHHLPVLVGAKVVRHGRYVTFQMAEVAVPRGLFRKILGLIDDLRRRPAPA